MITDVNLHNDNNNNNDNNDINDKKIDNSSSVSFTSSESEVETDNYNIYRYKFSENIIYELDNFSKIHKYDDKNTFKESWEKWVSENLYLIQREEERLSEIGYKGCVKTKMYKSCRYYFSKKTSDKEKQERRKKYVMVNSSILTSMDNHIIENISKEDYKPAIGYEEYCQKNIELLKEDIVEMVALDMNINEIKMKIKKTYKNRYFIISRNISKYKQLYENNSIVNNN